MDRADRRQRPEKPDSEFTLKGDSDLSSERGAQKRIFLAEDLPFHLPQVHRDDLSRIGRGKSDMALATTVTITEVGHEQGFPGKGPLTGTHQFAH